jgi:hypothetical protein
MKDDQSHLAQLFEKGPRPSARENETDDALPANDDAYAAFARRSNKPEFSLHFITAAGTMRSFQYAHLDSNSGFTAECISLRFMGMTPMKVLIHGRNLRQLYDCIHQHKIAWVREAVRPFAADNETIVTRVKIEPVREESDIAAEI